MSAEQSSANPFLILIYNREFAHRLYWPNAAFTLATGLLIMSS